MSATLSTAAAARSVQMGQIQTVASTFDFRACDVHRNVGARVEGPHGLDSLLSRDTAITYEPPIRTAHEDRPTLS